MAWKDPQVHGLSISHRSSSLYNAIFRSEPSHTIVHLEVSTSHIAIMSNPTSNPLAQRLVPFYCDMKVYAAGHNAYRQLGPFKRVAVVEPGGIRTRKAKDLGAFKMVCNVSEHTDSHPFCSATSYSVKAMSAYAFYHTNSRLLFRFGIQGSSMVRFVSSPTFGTL